MISCLGNEKEQSHISNLLTNDWYRKLSLIYCGILNATHEFFRQEKISPTIFPITTGAVSSPMGRGSDSLPITVNIRGNDVYLADSMQFSLEIGARLSELGAYYVMPAFRGEPMDTRHLNEFFHSEAEIRGNLSDVMALVRRYIIYLAKFLLEFHSNEILNTAKTLDHIDSLITHPENHFREIPYHQALEELNGIPGAVAMSETNFPVITAIGETQLIKRFGEFTWLTHMPWDNVPFYQARQPGTDYSMTADLLAGIGEIVGCGQRVLSPSDVDDSLSVHQVPLKGYEWYIEMREVQEIQTSGFGLGIERFILWLTRKQDIRDCMLLIRNHDHVSYP